MTPLSSLRRVANALRKRVAGLPLGGEAVWPGLRNDLFVAHESIYRFAARWAADARVLDAACGTGYGSALLADAGARSVLGIDREPRRVRFARRRYRTPALRFEVADCEALELASGSLDLAVSSNTLEHLARPESFLDAMTVALAPGGLLVVAVPPVLSDDDRAEHARNVHHLSNLPLGAWAELFAARGWSATYVSHRASVPLDLRSYGKSRVLPGDFVFTEEEVHRAYESPPISALFLLRRTGDCAQTVFREERLPGERERETSRAR